jgi:uncharacterized protein YwgA
MIRQQRKRETEKAVDIVRAAGGTVVGRTRLQKIGYLLELAGLGDGFSYAYRYYGPYSDDLAAAARTARLFGLLQETEHPASWGGTYSVFTVPDSGSAAAVDPSRRALAHTAAEADPVELELAATAAFLSADGAADPWAKTARLKPQKAQDGRLDNAKALYRRLQGIATPRPLPRIG